MRVRSYRPVLGILLSLLLTVGLAPTPARAAPGELRVDLPTSPELVSVLAASGDRLLADFDEELKLSDDGGETWVAAALTGDRWSYDFHYLAGGVLYFSDEDGVLYAFSLLTNEVEETPVYAPGGEGAGSGIVTGFDGAHVFVLDGSGEHVTIVPLDGSAPLGPFDRYLNGWYSWDHVLADGSVLGTIFDEDEGDGNGIVRATSEGRTIIESLGEGEDWALVGGLIVIANEETGQLCTRTIESPTRTCRQLAHDGEIGFSLSEFDGGVLAGLSWVPIAGGSAGQPVTVQLSEGTVDVGPPIIAGGEPVFSSVTASGSYIEKVNPATGATTRVETGHHSVVAQTALSLTPSAIVGSDSQGRAWRRSVGSSIGAQSVLAQRASAVASGTRWAVTEESGTLTWHDGSEPGATISGLGEGLAAVRMSGPNVLVEGSESAASVRTAGGTTSTVPGALDIFGSSVLQDVTPEDEDDGDEFTSTLRVRDLAGSAAPAEFTVPFEVRRGFLWGDYAVVAGWNDAGPVVIRNHRQGTTVDRCGAVDDLVGLGDGFVLGRELLGYEDGDTPVYGPLVACGIAAGTQVTVDDASDLGWVVTAAVDGDRVAYTTETELVITTVPGVATSAPRSLGVVAPATWDGSGTWTPEIDLTKPVDPGELVIKNSAGDTVRELAVGASADGSVRGVGWDGKDSAGGAVPPGSYTIELTSEATDGSGAVVRTDGTAGALATVTVTGRAPMVSAPASVSISGTAKTDQTLTVAPGTWGPSGVSLARQWLRDGTAIPGATGTTYKVLSSDVGRKISVRVTGSLSGAEPVSRTSVAVTVGVASLTAAPVPSVSGTVVIGKTLTASPGVWGPPPVTLRYQWRRNGAAIAGATRNSYVVQPADANAALSVTVSGSKAGYGTVSKTSKATTKVPGYKLTATPVPTISGTAKVGSKLTAKPGTWKPSGVKLAYQWYRSGKAISGATKSSYTLAGADKGKKITVKVTGSKLGYTSVARTSRATKVVAAGKLTVATPKVSGTAKVGSRLTAKPGTWKPAPVTLKYQWLRSGKAIKGATKATYTLVTADRGKKITVKVSATKTGYTAASRTSKATAKVK